MRSITQREMDEYLRKYGNTETGRNVHKQMYDKPETPDIKSKEKPMVCTKRFNVYILLYRLILITVGVVVLTINPIAGILLFIWAHSIRKD